MFKLLSKVNPLLPTLVYSLPACCSWKGLWDVTFPPSQRSEGPGMPSGALSGCAREIFLTESWAQTPQPGSRGLTGLLSHLFRILEHPPIPPLYRTACSSFVVWRKDGLPWAWEVGGSWRVFPFLRRASISPRPPGQFLSLPWNSLATGDLQASWGRIPSVVITTSL